MRATSIGNMVEGDGSKPPPPSTILTVDAICCCCCGCVCVCAFVMWIDSRMIYPYSRVYFGICRQCYIAKPKRILCSECVPFSSSGPYHTNYMRLLKIKVTTFWFRLHLWLFVSRCSSPITENGNHKILLHGMFIGLGDCLRIRMSHVSTDEFLCSYRCVLICAIRLFTFPSNATKSSEQSFWRLINS